MDPQQILTGAQDALTARRVFGDPIDAGGVWLVPAAFVRGGGGGGGRADGSGVGFGVVARPAGAFVIRNGEAKWRPAVDVNRVILGGQIVAATAVLIFGSALFRWLGRRQTNGFAGEQLSTAASADSR